MDARFFYEQLSSFRHALRARGYDVRLAQAPVTDREPSPVLVQMPRAVVGRQSIVAVPDVHLSDTRGGDIFFDGSVENVRRLGVTLRALNDFMRESAHPVTALQLGDWYDVWRAIGHDTTDSRYTAIDNAPAYQEILSLDKQLGLAHLIGNHDASFTHALPDRRVADGSRFRFGFALGNSNGRIYALHGHQTDRIEGEPNADLDQLAVWIGTLAATFVSSDFRNLEELIDKRGTDGALVWIGGEAAEAAVAQLPGGLALVKTWLRKLLAQAREDVPASDRPPLESPPDGEQWFARFVRRENAARLARIAATAAEHQYGARAATLELLIVGHSHKPCVSWTRHPRTGSTILIADAGSWSYGQAQILFAAGNTLAVYDVVSSSHPAVR